MSGDKRGGRLKPGGDPWEQRRKNVVKKHLGDKIDRTSWWLVEMWRRTGNQGQLLGALVGSGSTEMGIQEKTVECNVRFLWFHRHKSETGKKWYLTMKNDIQSHRGTLTNLNNGLKSESWSIWIFTGDNERDGNNGQKGGGKPEGRRVGCWKPKTKNFWDNTMKNRGPVRKDLKHLHLDWAVWRPLVTSVKTVSGRMAHMKIKWPWIEE